MNDPVPPAERDGPPAHAPGQGRTSNVHFSHVTTGRWLPPPGKAPGWPFAEIGHWQIDAQAAAEDWLTGLREWRREHRSRLGWDDSAYRRPDLQWAQRNIVHVQTMVEDRYFYDPESGRYTVDRYLDDLERRYGGVDSVLVWYAYPNIGIDERNQFDLARSLPGGVQGLRGAVADFHRRGVRVFLPAKPWDHGTRDEGRPEWEAMAELVRATGADGINGDTYNGVPRAFYDACDSLGCPVVLEPESTISSEEQLMWNVQSWTKKVPADLVPVVPKWKWVEPRHMIHIENRWGRDRRHDLQNLCFNGIGYNAWENVWGIWNGLVERDAEVLRRLATIFRACAPLLVSAGWAPYAPTLQRHVYASRFPGDDGRVLHTLVNRVESDLDGEQLVLPHPAGARYVDLWHGRELVPRVDGGCAWLSFPIEALGYGAVLTLAPGAAMPELPELLQRLSAMAARPLASLSTAWRSLPQTMVTIAPTAPRSEAPEGMVTIPGGPYDFVVGGVEIEGQLWDGVDVQYPWEPSARRFHRHRLDVPTFHIDRTPVTNAQFQRFVQQSRYVPQDAGNYLRHWVDGAPPAGWDHKPVTWVSLEDARAYAAWAGKRLPHEWEWQLAAQGRDGRLYPWGSTWDGHAVPPTQRGRTAPVPADVGCLPRGASPYGVLDLVGHVWQWTDEYRDEHTRAAVLRGGSAYLPQTSHWYFPQAQRLDQHGKYLLMAPGKDRSGCIGFRCVVDAG